MPMEIGTTLVRHTASGQEEIPLRLDDLMAGDDLSANLKLEPGDAIVIPEGFFSGGWVLDYSYTASQVFTDNIDQDRDGGREIRHDLALRLWN